jgi:hypothetical protein
MSEPSMSDVLNLRDECKAVTVVSVQAETLESIISCLLQFRDEAQVLHGVCHALNMPVPQSRRPDYGSSFAGGSAFEARKQDEWDAKVRTEARKGLGAPFIPVEETHDDE